MTAVQVLVGSALTIATFAFLYGNTFYYFLKKFLKLFSQFKFTV